MRLALLHQGGKLGGAWLCCLAGFKGSGQGPALGTDIIETKECAFSEVQLGRHQMDAPNDAESTGLRQGLREPRLAKRCKKELREPSGQML